MSAFIKIFSREKKKKTVCIVGNCVTGAVPEFLNTSKWFKRRYECVGVKPIHTITTQQDIDEFKQIISGCDVFLTQPIGGERYKNLGIDTESMKKLLKPNAKFFAIPTPYFIGYFPEQIYLHDSNGIMIGECEGLPSPYHNKIILYGYINKISPEKIHTVLYDDKEKCDVKRAFQESLAELKKREQGLSFTISNFIESNYKKQRLFWSINHPTNALIKYMSQRILRLLSKRFIFMRYNIKSIPNEFLNNYVTPILPSVQKELDLEITDAWDNQKYTLDFVKDVYAYYDKHPELVEANKPFVEDIIKI